jgi:uncharacterized surface anchored protein
LGSLVVINSTHDGQLLTGALFAVYYAGDTERLVEIETNFTGRTMEIPLSQGNYNIVILVSAYGHAPIADAISTTITAGQRQELTIFSVPIYTPEPPLPVVEYGRLIITLRAQGTGQLLSGAVFELRNAMDGDFITFLITDSFGEAIIDLPATDYFLREIQAVSGFIPNPNRVNLRIAANRLNEVNLTSQPEPVPTPTPTPEPPPAQQEAPPEPGLLVITVITEGTREPIQGAGFEVRRAFDNHLVAELMTDRFGEAGVMLPPDDYFLRQINAPQYHNFNTERVNVRIAAGAIREVTVINRYTPAAPPAEETTPVVVENGRILITATSSETNERLEGVVYTIHDVMTDEIITTIATNSFGEASALLSPGQYFKRNAVMPQNYSRDMERVNFTIRANEIISMNVTARAIPQPTPMPEPPATPTPQPTPQQVTTAPSQSAGTQNRPVQPQNRVEIFTRAELSGHPLHGATFAVYRVSDSQRVGEITTDANGRAVISLSPGEYYMRNNSVQFGFLREQSRIFFTVRANSNVTVEVTIQRDLDIPYVNYGDLTLPQTGELPPVMNYVLGVLFLAFAMVCGIVLYRGISLINYRDQKHYKRRNYKRRRVLDYA